MVSANEFGENTIEATAIVLRSLFIMCKVPNHQINVLYVFMCVKGVLYIRNFLSQITNVYLILLEISELMETLKVLFMELYAYSAKRGCRVIP